jgi:O-antigen/teichoic acid export membrane protein
VTAPTVAEARDDPPAANVSTAARGTALNLAGSIAGSVIGFVTIGVVTNRWGRAGSGLFFAATALFTLAANGARMGSEAGLTYFVARLRADDRPGSVPRVVGVALAATASVSTILAAIGLLFAPHLSGLLTSDVASRADATTMVRILAVAVPTFALSQALLGASRGFGTMRPSVVSGQLIRPLSQLVLVLVVVSTVDSLPALALAWAASSALTMVSIGSWVRRRLALVRRRNTDPPDGNVTGAYLRFSVGRAGADLVAAALERIDVILVAAVLGQSAAGLYGASGRLILAGQLLMIAAAQSTAPLLAASFTAGRDDEARHLLRTITAWNVTVLWPVFICLGFGAETALSVFGDEFRDGTSLVVVLSLTMLTVIGIGGGDIVVTSTGDSLASFLHHVAGLVVLVVASLVLMPRVGLIGGALAWALCRLTLRSLATLRVWQTRRVHAMGRPVLLAAGAAAAAYVPLGLATSRLIDNGPLAVAVNVGAGAAIHLALLSRLRSELELDHFLATVVRRRRASVS